MRNLSIVACPGQVGFDWDGSIDSFKSFITSYVILVVGDGKEFHLHGGSYILEFKQNHTVSLIDISIRETIDTTDQLEDYERIVTKFFLIAARNDN